MKAACNRVQFAANRHPLDGGDSVSFRRDRQRQAGVDARAVDQHSAGAALTVVASLLRSGVLKPLAKQIEQSYTRVKWKSCNWPLIVSE
jgi:hypothetical protein